MDKARKAAHTIWKVTRWVTGTIIAFLIAYAANLAVIRGKDFPTTSFAGLMNWLFLPGFNRIVIFSILALLFITTLFSGILVATEHSKTLSAVTPQSRHRRQMLERMQATWITGVLEDSLHGAVLIALGLKEQKDALMNPWRLVFQQPNQPERQLPTGIHITEAYDEAGGELLILGEPGSGKTTLLLELTRDLLDRARRDDEYQMPVIFNLSSWAVSRKDLAEWFIEELNTRYQVPTELGRIWLDTDQILPLLDGLDEMNFNARSVCIEAINTYRQKHMVPTVVCSRKAEYLDQTKRLALRNAVTVQPLMAQQIDDYLSSLGGQLAAVSMALKEDKELQKLATTPLMLSILTLTYHGKMAEELRTKGSLEERRRQIFATYVQRMLERRGIYTRYSSQQVVHWLTWMAHHLIEHNQATFSFKWMRIIWIPQQRIFKWASILSSGLLLGVLVGFLFWLPIGPLVGVRTGFLFGLLVWSHFDSPLTSLANSISGQKFGMLGQFQTKLFDKRLAGTDLFVVLAGLLIFGLLGMFLCGLLVAVHLLWLLRRPRSGNLFFDLSRFEVVRNALVFGLVSGMLFWLYIGPIAGLLGGLLVALMSVGFVHYLLYFQCDIILRLLLSRTGYMPFKYDRFLDYAVDRILLRKVGDSYIFIHRLLLDYFISLDNL